MQVVNNIHRQIQFLTAHSMQKNNLPMKDFIHHHPRTLPYDRPSQDAVPTFPMNCPGQDAV